MATLFSELLLEPLVGFVIVLFTLRTGIDYRMNQSQFIGATGTRRLHRVKYRFHFHLFILPFCLSALLLSLFVDRYGRRATAAALPLSITD